MPFVTEDDPTPLGVGNTYTPPPNPIAPTMGEIVGAAFRQDNTLVNIGSRLAAERFPSQDGYNPLDTIRGTPFEQNHADKVLGSRSEAETRDIMRRVDSEEADARLLDASGFVGTIASISAGTIDPTLALPAGTIYRAGKSGYTIAKSAVSVGLAAGLSTAAQEAILQSTQETRTALQSTTAIGSATLLGALIGSGASAILSRGERSMLERSVTRERSAIDAHNDGLATPRATDTTTGAVHDDIASQLRAAGRPEDEVQVGAALTAARYETLGAQFGKTAEEMYRAQNISVRGGEAASEPIGEKSFAQSWLDDLISRGKSEPVDVKPAPSVGVEDSTFSPINRKKPRDFVDPRAKEWTLYHGTSAVEPFERFEPTEGNRKLSASGESGAVFLSPSPTEASGYAAGGRADPMLGQAGDRVFKVTVDPGKTRVFDLPDLIQNDPQFRSVLREVNSEYASGPTSAAERDMLGQMFDQRLEQAVGSLEDDRGIRDQLRGQGVPDDEISAPSVFSSLGGASAAIRIARAEGYDTIIVRGLGESNGGDQVVVINPNRVFGAYTGKMMYQGGAAKAGSFDVFHGSRHSFDKFDSSKLGTGYGEQESGRGLYFNESRDPAASYMDPDVPSSTLYKARINANREDFVGIDTELRAQPQPVQQALRPLVDQLLSDPYVREFMAPGSVDDQTIGTILEGVRRTKSDKATVKVESGTVEKALREAGVPGITYGREAGSRNYVVFDDKAVEVIEKNGKAPLKQDARGRITLDDNKAIVDLFAGADRSTFVHEMGHKWLAELMHYADVADAPAGLKADRDTVLKWLGVDKADAIGVSQHEQWARGFEQYLAEGKAPTTALAQAFERFKEWLTTIYRSLTDLNSPVSDDIRGVMDRLLATDQQIAASRQPLSNIEAPPIAASAGAAATDTRTLELESSGLGWTAGLSPTRRVMAGESIEGRRTMADLAGMPYRFKENVPQEGRMVEGVLVGARPAVATTQGPPLDLIAKMHIEGTKVEVADTLDRMFAEYRFGDPTALVPRIRSQFERMIGTDTSLMAFDEFKEEIAGAMREGDQHSIPQVQQAAQYIRDRVFETWKKRTIEAGIFGEGVDVKTAESYLQRIYNKELIKARRPEFVSKVTDWLTSDQETKRAQKERLTAYNNGLEVVQGSITKMEARIAALSEDVEVIDARREEATRVNKFAFERSTALREGEYANVGGIREDRPGKNIEKARGGAVFETKVRERGNVLSDRASGKLAQIEELERKLADEIAKHDQIRTKIEKEIANWEGKSVSEAKSAMKARQAAEDARTAKLEAAGSESKGGRLSSADAAIDRAVRRIMESDRELGPDELRSKAHEITDHILGGPAGRLPYDIASGGPEIGWSPAGGQPPRGPLASREFNIPDAMISDFLEKDIEAIVGAHLRTIVPDVLLTERFGDVLMTEPLKRIQEEYAARIDASKSEKEAKRLASDQDEVISRIVGVRDRIRGVFGFAEGGQKMARVAASAKIINNLTSMGSAAVSSLPDFAGVVFRHGFATTFRDGWIPYVRYLTGNNPEFGKFKTQMRALGIGVEVATSARQHALDDVIDGYKPQSRIERGLQYVNDKFFIANLLAPLTDIQKTVASHVAMSEVLRAAKAASGGKATSRQLANLAESNIDQNMAGRIWSMFETGGTVTDGVHLPNTADWRDKQAAQALNGAVARDVDIMVVTPGQEKPLWMSKPVIGLLGQFKTFTASSTERILVANLQRRDAAVLQGLIASIGLGMLSYAVNGVTGGTKTSDRPQDWLKEGISRGGITGWFEEGNALASKMTRGGVDVYRMIGANKPMTRFASRSALDMILGPTAGKVQGFFGVTGAAAAASGLTPGERQPWTESDTTALRRLFFLQNLIYVRRVLNEAEGGLNGMLGVEQKAR